MSKIAGHSFDAGPLGNRCSNKKYTDGAERECGVNLPDILCARKEDIGKEGFSCYGTLIEKEYGEIEAERDRIWAAIKSG